MGVMSTYSLFNAFSIQLKDAKGKVSAPEDCASGVVCFMLADGTVIPGLTGNLSCRNTFKSILL